MRSAASARAFLNQASCLFYSFLNIYLANIGFINPESAPSCSHTRTAGYLVGELELSSLMLQRGQLVALCIQFRANGFLVNLAGGSERNGIGLDHIIR